MKLSDVGAYALSNLGRHKLRTLLTCTGVGVGVAVLTVMVSLGSGLRLMVSSQFDQAELITRITVARTGEWEQLKRVLSGGSGGPQVQLGPPITDEAIESFKTIPGVVVAYPAVMVRLVVEANGRMLPVGADGLPVEGLTAGYQEALLAGSYWTREDAGNVCVLPSSALQELGYDEPADALGTRVAVTSIRYLFGYRRQVEERPDPAGGPPVEVVRWERPQGAQMTELDVIGVYDSKRFGVTGSLLHVPMQPAKLLQERYAAAPEREDEDGGYRRAVVKVASHADLDPVIKAVEAKGYDTQTVYDILSVIRVFFIAFQVLLSFFGGIGLFVAFFGIANTMLMAVLERTREVGVLKALGARDRDVRRLFVSEAAAIGLLGGGAGVGLGWLAGLVLNGIAGWVAGDAAPEGLALFYVEGWLVAGGLGLSTFVAVVAGIYPAWRAARLDPVDSLRRE